MSQDAIYSNVIGGLIVAFVVWSFSLSLKSWVKTIIDDHMVDLKSKLGKISEIAVDNRKHNENIRSRVAVLASDFDKLEKRTAKIAQQLSTLKCTKGIVCENTD